MSDDSGAYDTHDKITEVTLDPDSNGEPLLTIGTLTGAAMAVITLLVSFSVPITDAQQTAIIGVIAVIAPFVTALLSRGRVFSQRTVARIIRDQPTLKQKS